MPVLAVLVALFLPRTVVALLWFFTGWFTGVFDTKLWPILGFLFMPLTLLWYSAVQNWFDGDWNWWRVIILLIAIVADLASDKSSKKS